MGSPLSGGFALNRSHPRGAFAQHTEGGYGGSINVLYSLDRARILGWRTELLFLSHGTVRQPVPLSPGIGDRVRVELRTSNQMVSMVTGPQLMGPSGRFSPYATLLGGFSAFWTESTVRGGRGQSPLAVETEVRDTGWPYGGAVGGYLRLGRGNQSVRLDLGARYLRHGEVRYLTPTEVRSAFNEGRDPHPIRSRADSYIWFLGVHAIAF